MQRTGNMEMKASEGRHIQGQYVNTTDPRAQRMPQQTKTKAGKKTRECAIWMLVGVLFLKFTVLLVLIGLMFFYFNTRILELQRNVKGLRKMISCERGWLEFDDHCYFFSNFALNWTNAENMCLNRNGHLVIINSQAEQKFLLDNFKGLSWIGLTDLEKEGIFKWIDGTGLSYTFWDTGEPNDLLQLEDCVHMYDEGWNDSICSDNSSYAICEKRLEIFSS
ncbi:CD209 antigen-like protein C [Mantella aurantiaca]